MPTHDNSFGDIPRSSQAAPFANAPTATTTDQDSLGDIPRSRPATGPSPGREIGQSVGTDTFGDIPRSGIAQTQAGAREEQPDPNAPWYEKTWDWANKPLIDLHRQGATGFEEGFEDVASSFTSPLSIALFAGTLGSGAALRALGVGAKELPLVVRGAKALLSAGFTGTQVAQVI